ncbi:MAG: trypsin-like peptidase domain-containing protein [Paucibacter sp.]|nr:trypsin-like peptidase domain-containing protein [Roseateles sp.]
MSSNRRHFCRLLALGALLAVCLPSEAGLPELIQRAKPSIVLVGTYAATDNPRFSFRGSGFVVGAGNALITNVHVLPEPDQLGGEAERSLMVQVRRPDGSWGERAAQIVALDREHDLALLHFEGPGAPALKLQAELAREGSEVAIMGFPVGGALGFSTVTHRGTVSAVTPIALPAPGSSGLNERAVRQLRNGSFDIYQLDATAYPGNSGGPVLDMQTGAVIGILNMVLVKGSKESALGSPTGISYAIPALYAAQLLSGHPEY